MTNDLKNFLEEETKGLFDKKLVTKQLPNGYRELLGEQVSMSLLWNLYDAIKDHDTHLVNFVLDLVEKEVEKKTIVWADTLQGYIKIVPKHDISTIVNNLKN